MAMHAMIDIETLATSPDAVILSVGACKFDPYTSKMPYERRLWKPCLEEQFDMGRAVCDSTVDWWIKQDREIFERALTGEGRIPLKEFFGYLNKYLVGVDKIWCQGPQFDMVILENIYTMAEHHRGWAYWQICDSRTIFNMMPVDPRKEIQQELHDAAADAYYQAMCVQKTYKHFGVQP
jgi:hypothetical protein